MNLTKRLGSMLRYPFLPRARLSRGWSTQSAQCWKHKRSPLVSLKTGEDRAPLILVHPIGGSILCYRELVACFANERDLPIYGLETTGEPPIPTTIEQMAEEYLRAASDVIGSKSCHLAGWSFGGIVAFEMARQLERTNNSAASLTLIDTALHPPFETDSRSGLSLVARALGVNVTPEMIGGDRLSAEWIVAAAKHTAGRQNLRLDAVNCLVQLVESLMRLRSAYRPGIIRGSLTLLRATWKPERNGEFNWKSKVEGEVRVCELPTSHETIMTEPRVQDVAAILKTLVTRT